MIVNSLAIRFRSEVSFGPHEPTSMDLARWQIVLFNVLDADLLELIKLGSISF